MKNKRIAFLVPYPIGLAPSQRFRVEQFFPILQKENIEYKAYSFLNEKSFRILYKPGNILKKFAGIANGFIKRLAVLFQLGHYEFVFIHREASPIGPPVFEWLICKVFRKKIIYDFDDAIWINDSDNTVVNLLKSTWKIRLICKWSYKIAAGNNYLAAYASNFNDQVVIMPTTVNTDGRHNKIKDQVQGNVVIGWTGSHSTLKYLYPLWELLKEICCETKSQFIVISNQPPIRQFEGLIFKQWKAQTEIEDLLKIDIGIMPLEQDKWSEGKCGFKLIQYLSLGIPGVASPVGINSRIIIHGENGFVANNLEEWRYYLKLLISDAKLRKAMGAKGRIKIEKEFSIHANEAKFLELFN